MQHQYGASKGLRDASLASYEECPCEIMIVSFMVTTGSASFQAGLTASNLTRIMIFLVRSRETIQIL